MSMPPTQSVPPTDGGHVEGRREIVEPLATQRLGEGVPVDAGLGADSQILGVDRKDSAHAGHVEQQPAVGDTLAFGGEGSTSSLHRHAVALGCLENGGHLLSRRRERHSVGRAVDDSAGITAVGGRSALFFADGDPERAQPLGEFRPGSTIPLRWQGLLA